MRRHPRKIIVVLNPDCVVHAPLNQLRHIRGDVALFMRRMSRGRGTRSAVRSGTMVFRPSRGAKRFLQLWAELSREASDVIDQSPLARAVARSDSITFDPLPQRFVAIPADGLGFTNVEFSRASDTPRKMGKLERILWRVTGW